VSFLLCVKQGQADVRNPQGIHIDGLELTPLGTATPNPEPAEDFFSTWDKEKPKAVAAPTAPKSATPPPSIGAKPASRTVTSSSLRAGATPGSARPAVSSRLSTSTTAGTAPKSSKLGAKKAVGGINFEEAQRKALEDKEREAEEKRKAAAAGERVSRTSTPVNGSSSKKEEKVAPARLGFGQTAGAAVVAQPKA
jgi:ADP-ribosylation factor GTPase-activating protein 2/3